MKAVASTAKKSDTVLLQAVDMDDGGPYEIADPRAIIVLDSFVPPCELRTPAWVAWLSLMPY